MALKMPEPGNTPSQRTLAAIVFTDVVSFSARMHTDEVATLKLLHRDFAEMRRLCTEHEGAVLKTTGDGLLLTFTSAVQAVACALAMQRQFAAEAKDPTSSNALQHRIGIHLGDVLVQDKDVMGDGVNIAARLQSEAEPGGICISQTVYDVVKNKLQMQAVSLGPRDLKNIAESMPVYRLLLEAQALDSKGNAVPSTVGRQTSNSGLKALIAVGAAAVVAITAFVVLRGRGQPATVVAASPTPAAVVPTPAPTAPPAAAKVAAPADIAADLSEEAGKRKDVQQEMHALYLDKYDFNGLVLALRDKAEGPSAPPALKQMLRSAEQLARLRSWLEATLRHYSRQHPLSGSDLSGDTTKDVSVYLAPDQRIVFIEMGNSVPRDWAEIKPPVIGAIIVGALHEAKETRRLIALDAQTFARLYSLPLMTKALAAAKGHAEEPAPR
jgi:class 3 adenylate cyclase